VGGFEVELGDSLAYIPPADKEAELAEIEGHSERSLQTKP
jgi:hypothetical protein